MSDLQVVESAVQRAARRRRWLQCWRGFWHGLAFGTAFWLITFLAFKLFPVPWPVLTAAGIVALAAPITAGCWYSWRRSSTLETARWIDLQQHLQERLSTALECGKSSRNGEWGDLVVADAARKVRQVDVVRLLPFQLPQASRWALLGLVLAAGLGFAPEFRSKEFLQKQKEAQNIKETGRQMAALVRRQINHRPPALEPSRKTMESVATLGDRLTQVKLTRDEALKQLASATERLREETKGLAKNPAFKRLEQAARSPETPPPSTAAGLQKQIEDAQKSLGEKAAKPEAADQVKKGLENLQEAAKGLNASDPASAASALEQVSQAAKELAAKAESLGLPLPKLAEAISALAENKIDQFLKDLEITARDLESFKSLAQALHQMQMQMEKIGKDLAEQLKNGQAQAARDTLRKMIDQLQSDRLDPRGLDKIAREVSEAVPPALPYGKVADHLKDATRKMRQNDQPAGAQSLAEAAKELEKLLEEFGDLEGLEATLDALQRAQMAVGNGQDWGLCQSRIPKAGKGGGLGAGVGTWADDNRWLDEMDVSEGSDNSGVERPDETPRGVANRGDGEVKDTLVPTKVKGKFAPGGPMPSITLKGVSIKGQSSVTFEQAAMTAQGEAQSALSQEQVPRAYQNAVRDYFDDLKK